MPFRLLRKKDIRNRLIRLWHSGDQRQKLVFNRIKSVIKAVVAENIKISLEETGEDSDWELALVRNNSKGDILVQKLPLTKVGRFVESKTV